MSVLGYGVTNTEHMMRRLLLASQRHLNAACDPKPSQEPVSEFKMLTSTATISAMCAYVLDALYTNDQGEADEVAQALDWHWWDGEQLADWVAEQLNRRGLEAEKVSVPSENPWRDVVFAYVNAEEGSDDCAQAWHEMEAAVRHYEAVQKRQAGEAS